MTTNLWKEKKPELYRNLTDAVSKVSDCTCTWQISSDMEISYRHYFSGLLKISDNLVDTQHRAQGEALDWQPQQPPCSLPSPTCPSGIPRHGFPDIQRGSQGSSDAYWGILLGNWSQTHRTKPPSQEVKKDPPPPLNKDAWLKNPKLLCNLPNWTDVKQGCCPSSAQAGWHTEVTVPAG